MAPRATKKVASSLRDIDDIVHIFTGKRIRQHARRIVDLVGEDIEKKVMNGIVGDEAIARSGPYAVLHCRPEASDTVVKYRFRALVKELHPDSGTHPDAREYQRVVEAYHAIMDERRKENTKGL